MAEVTREGDGFLFVELPKLTEQTVETRVRIQIAE